MSSGYWTLILNGIVAAATTGYTILTFFLWKEASSQALSAREMLRGVQRQSQDAVKLAQLSADAVMSTSLSIHFQNLAGNDAKYKFAEEAAASGISREAIQKGFALGNTAYSVLNAKDLEAAREKLDEAIKAGVARQK